MPTSCRGPRPDPRGRPRRTRRSARRVPSGSVRTGMVAVLPGEHPAAQVGQRRPRRASRPCRRREWRRPRPGTRARWDGARRATARPPPRRPAGWAAASRRSPRPSSATAPVRRAISAREIAPLAPRSGAAPSRPAPAAAMASAGHGVACPVTEGRSAVGLPDDIDGQQPRGQWLLVQQHVVDVHRLEVAEMINCARCARVVRPVNADERNVEADPAAGAERRRRCRRQRRSRARRRRRRRRRRWRRSPPA